MLIPVIETRGASTAQLGSLLGAIVDELAERCCSEDLAAAVEAGLALDARCHNAELHVMMEVTRRLQGEVVEVNGKKYTAGEHGGIVEVNREDSQPKGA